MRVTDKRLKEVINYSKEYGIQKTLQTYKTISNPETVGRYKREAYRRGIFAKPYNDPKILLFDIETAPLEVYAWDTGKDYIRSGNIIKGRSILTWSAKWLCDNQIFNDSVSPKQARDREDRAIVGSLHNLIDKADVIIAHNCRGFDKKIFNTRAIINEFQPPSPYRIIDTYRQARRNFKFLSNSLDYIGQTLVNDNKIKTSMDLWKRCVTGDKYALENMVDYNIQDVRLLEEVFFKLRGWMTRAPNMAMYYPDMGNRCPRCGSTNLITKDDYYFTTANRYKAKHCKECGAWGRARHSDLTAADKEELLRPVAR